MKCNYTIIITKISGLCKKYDNLQNNKRLKEALKVTSVVINNDDVAMWASLAQMGMNGAFNCEKTFTELVSLMLQIKKKDDAGTKLGYITGSTLSSNEITISNIDDIHPKIKYIYEKNAIAIQVQVIILKISIGKIPLMPIAILPTKGDGSAKQIFNIFRMVLEFVHQSNINILSIGADDARLEFNAQIQIINSASTYYTFNDPFYDVHLKIPIINGKLLVCVQDPKHTKKTVQNQLFTRA
ncbi:hypothetical protein C1646_754221 [Rhizophagus diaphanus]|nr:hypothetical protein C1646_754221 [Rhizophagus diaphanus] [Rhizophagus sp. MUCL 43196]